MYEEFYNLNSNPFQLSPDPGFFFGSRTHSKAMAYLTFGLDQGEGFIIVTGEVGAGKTTVIGNLLKALDNQQYLVSSVVTPHAEPDTVLRLVAAGLGIAIENRDSASVISDIQSLLHAAYRDGQRVILIVDEAQNLSDPSLEQLRMLLNYQVEGRALLQIILVGQPELRTRLAADGAYEQIRQRVIATCHLMPLAGKDETGEYLTHRLAVAGHQGEPIFTPDAVAIIHEFCEGIPRRINQLASRLLLHGFLAESRTIDAEAAEEVCSEMRVEWDPDPLGSKVVPSLAWDKDGTG